MTAYLARIAVHDVHEDERAGMGDALRARSSERDSSEPVTGAVTFEVFGEAPDLATAAVAARQHAAEILDGYSFEVDVVDLP